MLIDNSSQVIYKNFMKKYILAPLCSGLIVPGLGQIINQNLKRGLFILAVVFILFIAGTIKLFYILRSILADANAGRWITVPIADRLQNKDLTLLWGLLGLFALVWIYSVLDAFLVGKKMESHKKRD
jgi:hypothetical protein